MADTPIEPPARHASPGLNTMGHRSSFAENLRHSPRSQRHPSLSHAAVQELINHSSSAKTGDPRFVGRDWKSINVRELVQETDVRWAELDTPVEKATDLLIDGGRPHVILLRENPNELSALASFDYNDLNAYLLVVVGLAHPDEDQKDLYSALAKKTREGIQIPLRDIQDLATRSPLVTLSENEDLSKAVEIFGSGVHRLLVCKHDSSEVVGVLSQLKLVQFLWDNGKSFPSIDQLYPTILRDLDIGTVQAISINGDRPLMDALSLMREEGLSSVAVVDNALNVIGNISTADVKLLTSTSSIPLLKNTCIHFISIILSERGIGDGKDSFPVFHVNPYSTLAHTVAKLVATRSHRMWVVESASPSPSSTPGTPLVTASMTHAVQSTQPGSGPVSPALSASFPAVSASALPGARISGRLTGVISLTDILNLFARQSGLNPRNPNDHRARRRMSSSSSMRTRPSIESVRGSSIDLRR